LKTLGEAEGEVKKKQKTGTGTSSQLKEAMASIPPPLTSIPETTYILLSIRHSNLFDFYNIHSL
jgi:hypothetical protein